MEQQFFLESRIDIIELIETWRILEIDLYYIRSNITNKHTHLGEQKLLYRYDFW